MLLSRLGPLIESQMRSASLDRLSLATGGSSAGSTTQDRGTPSRAAAGSARCTSAGCRRGGVDVHREVEEVADRQPDLPVRGHPRGLEDVEAFDQDDVGLVQLEPAVGHHVVLEVGVDRCRDLVLAGLDVDDELEQRPPVVRLGEALALEQTAALELGVGVEEAVGRDQRDVGVLGPVRQQLAQQPRGGRLADRDRTGDADDERRALRLSVRRGRPSVSRCSAPTWRT